uniref:NADH-ubiquinone oxidoreductase chain 6 n=1 Tax=Speleomantes italicus TaxID=57555 RepID=Q645B2_9SALA|nr:NADH dehydrogenase subunit 6 [Speleomantes italicus]
MVYISFLALMGLVVGFIAMVSNPSPFYAALGLVFGVVCSCWVLIDFGVSFLSLVLLLIYLGGMLVVFAYSAFLAAELYPEAWGSWSVFIYILVYFLGVIICYVLMYDERGFEEFSDGGLSVVIFDYMGVGLMYTLGMLFLFVSGWMLLLTLFVVLEITRGVSRGSLRAV